MSATLLDINVLLALSWKDHVHYVLVNKWLDQFTGSWATCPFTQTGFVRISCNSKFLQNPPSPANAIQLLTKLTHDPRHIFWPDTIDLRSPLFPAETLRGHQQITDAYLFSLAIGNNAKLATLDTGIASLARNEKERQSIILLKPVPQV